MMVDIFEDEVCGKHFLRDMVKKYRKVVIKHRGYFCEDCGMVCVGNNYLYLFFKDGNKWNCCSRNVLLLCRDCKSFWSRKRYKG